MRFSERTFFSFMHPSELSDILEGCKKKDPKKQEALFNAYSSILFGICRRYIPDRDDAEDVLQDSFIKIFLNINQYKGAGSFEGWMKKITVNSALLFLKNKKKIRFEFSELADIQDADTMEDLDPEEEIDKSFILKCIEELPLGYRTVLNLFLVEKHSHKEIAAELNIKEATSRSQYTKARRQLTEIIKKRQVTVHERK